MFNPLLKFDKIEVLRKLLNMRQQQQHGLLMSVIDTIDVMAIIAHPHNIERGRNRLRLIHINQHQMLSDHKLTDNYSFRSHVQIALGFVVA